MDKKSDNNDRRDQLLAVCVMGVLWGGLTLYQHMKKCEDASNGLKRVILGVAVIVIAGLILNYFKVAAPH